MSECQKETCQATVMSTITIALFGFLVYCLVSPLANYTWSF